MEGAGKEEDETVCLDESFFINDDYQLTTFSFGSQVLQVFCLQSASTDFDLTGQLVWPGATLLNNYLSMNPEILYGRSMIELGSGVGITGILCSRFCCEVMLTDHNEEVLKILKKNIELHSSSDNSNGSAELISEKLEWGNLDQLNQILERHPEGFDLVLGADIYILMSFSFAIGFKEFQQSTARTGKNIYFFLVYIVWDHTEGLLEYVEEEGFLASIPSLFDTVEQLLRIREKGHCKFLLAYVSRAKVMDAMVISEAVRHGLQITEVAGSRSVVGNLEGVIFEITLQ